jgi:hypothetical protein
MKIGSSSISALLENLALTTGERRIQISERDDPMHPPPNQAYIYCRDNGAGKTQLVVRFATGPIRVLATQA